MRRIAWLVVFASCVLSFADVVLPSLFTDHAVLRRSDRTPVFGKASPGEAVSVTIGSVRGETKAGDDGAWRVNLDLTKLGAEPYELTVQGNNTLVVKDVLVGEVWLCSGQSNMQFSMNGEERAKELIQASANKQIRLFKIRLAWSLKAKDDVEARWEVVDPSNVGRFSAVGYLFGKELQAALGGAIGLIDNSWGGSAVESWVTLDQLRGEDKDLEQWSEKTYDTFVNYDARRDEYIKAYDEWLKSCGRTRPDFARNAPAQDAKWVENQRLSQRTFNGDGIVWFKKSINVTEGQAKSGFSISLGQFGAPVATYIDGKWQHGSKHSTAVAGNHVSVFVKGGTVAAGKHELLLRVWATEKNFRITRPGRFSGAGTFEDGWSMCVEPYPALTDAQLKSRPDRPAFKADVNKVPELLYNALIVPLYPYAISGTIWYQGCTNAGRPRQYPAAIRAMVRQWRKGFESEFPFYYCQLANYQGKNADAGAAGWGEIRVGQEGVLTLPKTGQAILIDVGEANDIHPLDKLTVAQRLAALALNQTYGKKDLPYSGPVVKTMKAEGSKVRVTFDFVYDGLEARQLPETYWLAKVRNDKKPLVRNSPDSQVEGFALCGADGKWQWANASIEGNDVVVWSDAVAKPVKIRYAFQSNPTCNLYNKPGFPAGPFEKPVK